MKTIGERIKELREEKGINQLELSKVLNVHKGSVSNWENNKRTPDADMLTRIADFFNCTVDYLLGNTDIREKLGQSLFNGSGYTGKGLNKLSDNESKDINKDFTLEYALKVLKENHDTLESKEDHSADEIVLSILNALIDTGALNEDNWNEDTMNIIKSAINMYIKNRKKTTHQE